MCMHWAFVMCRPLDRYQHGGSSYASRLKRAAVGPISFDSMEVEGQVKKLIRM